MTSTWEKTGRDAAHDDIMRGGEPCTTIAEARLRCGAWLRSQPELGVTDADVETCAGAYLRTWEAHRRDTSPPDLDAIDARHAAAVREAAIASHARVERDVCEAAGEAWDPRHDAADVVRRAVAAARREGAGAMREACMKAAAWDDDRFDGCHAGDVQEIIEAAIRALPLPEAPPDASTYRRGAGAMREACAQAAARVASAWARCECRCACGSSLAGLAAAEACAAEIRALPIVEAP